MKNVFGIGLAAIVACAMVGCTPESRDSYGEAGEKVSEGVQQDASAADATMDAAAVTGKVKTALMQAEGVDSEHINVDTMDKTVTLKGTVDSEEMKTKAEEVAKTAVDTDFTIDNQLVVGTASPTDPASNNATNDGN